MPYGKCYVRKLFSEGPEHVSYHLADTIYALLLRSFSSLREEKRVPPSPSFLNGQGGDGERNGERAFFPEERKLRKERHGWCSAKEEHCSLAY